MRARLHVEGTVQGVGFRPFVHALAGRFGLGGFVGNDGQGVFIEIEGTAAAVDAFCHAVVPEAPALAVVEAVERAPLPTTGETDFSIVTSESVGRRLVPVPPDTATCGDCLRELFDPADRRFCYPFTNCTNCGPRFSIVTGVPYDRPTTTMAGFPLCPACEREYHDPRDRRFHAQPVCCPDCGPRLRLVDADGRELAGDPIEGAARLLGEGRVVAVKGLGGYHLAVDAADEEAVAALRARKEREEKPFAVMAPDLAGARLLCDIRAEEVALLTGPERPIVLLVRREDAPIAPSVAPGNRFLGVVLPYTPVHHLLAGAHGQPFVLTSGNVSDEPIAYGDDDAMARLAGIADAFLTSDRPIHMRVDDSVVRVVAGRPGMIRRSRGYAPRPLTLPWGFRRPVLACGAELKSTFCIGRGRHAYLSHHIGDLENYETFRSYTEGIEHFGRLLDVAPEVVAHDLHPDYLSTTYALELEGVDLVGVQHHHAHIASCLADNGEEGPVIGVAYDGLGFGSDGTLWGGEVLAADLVDFERLGHLEPVAMPGGAAAIRQPWRMAAAYLDQFDGEAVSSLEVRVRHEEQWSAVLAAARAGVNTPVTTSMGRLFDAVAAVLGVRDVVSYEGQAAIELEQLADVNEAEAYRAEIVSGTPFLLRGVDLVRAAAEDLAAGVAPATIAGRFHSGVALMTLEACVAARERTGHTTVALSGGVFQNALLVERVVPLLASAGFSVLTHQRVPANDGGISLGQAVVAGARDRRG